MKCKCHLQGVNMKNPGENGEEGDSRLGEGGNGVGGGCNTINATYLSMHA